MLSPEKLFGNHFKEIAITNRRFLNFLMNFQANLQASNDAPTFAALIAELETVIGNLRTELGDVDENANFLKGKTMTNDEVVASFSKTMGEAKGVIAYSVGGEQSEAFLEFYPNGQSEYGRATKEQMTTFVDRIFKAATHQGDRLPVALKEQLLTFQDLWNGSRHEQELQKGSLETNRTEVTTARANAEITATIAIHRVALQYPTDVEKCNSFFSFNLLYKPAASKDGLKADGTVAMGETEIAFNKSFSQATSFTLTNTSTNASYIAWFSMTATGNPGGDGMEVKAGETHHVNRPALGNADATFLLVKNLSEANSVAYMIDAK